MGSGNSILERVKTDLKIEWWVMKECGVVERGCDMTVGEVGFWRYLSGKWIGTECFERVKTDLGVEKEGEKGLSYERV